MNHASIVDKETLGDSFKQNLNIGINLASDEPVSTMDPKDMLSQYFSEANIYNVQIDGTLEEINTVDIEFVNSFCDDLPPPNNSIDILKQTQIETNTDAFKSLYLHKFFHCNLCNQFIIKFILGTNELIPEVKKFCTDVSQNNQDSLDNTKINFNTLKLKQECIETNRENNSG